MSVMQRQLGPDYAKMLGIILVVWGHTIRGLINADILPADSAFWLNLDRAIYLFHMPLFFFLSGMFIQQTLAKTSLVDFFKRNVLLFIVPLIFWSYTQSGIQYLASANVNVERSLDYVIQAPFPPKQQFWFLWALFLIACFSGVLLKLGMGKKTLLVLAVLTMAALSVGHMLGLDAISFKMAGQTFGEALFFYPYFVMGVMLSSSAVTQSRTGFALSMLIFAGSIVLYLSLYRQSNAYYYLFSLTAVYSCYQAIAYIAEWVQRRVDQSDSRVLQNLHACLIFIGMNSFIIYLAHIIPEAGIRVVLLKLGFTQAYIHIIAGNVLGLLAPLLLVPVNLLLVRYWKSVKYIFPVRRMQYG